MPEVTAVKLASRIAAALALATAPPLAAQEARPAPKLIVMVSVDQLSADLFAEYRGAFTQGFARLASGAVFPAGYQGHAGTETCPGHSTILTGARPSRTGIVANDWIDFVKPGADKTLYCVEDLANPPAGGGYAVTPKLLRVPTLGEWMKGANPSSRVVAVSGKDRSAVMMAGHDPDEIWWWDGKGSFISYPGRTAPAMVTRMNAGIATRIAEAQPALDLPALCREKSRAIPIGGGKTVGDGRFARAAGDARAYRASPEFDESILALAAGLATDMKLGKGTGTDLLIVGASATDYVGHSLGTQGSEMCLQLLSLDRYLGQLMAVLDKSGVDYAVALTADHGGLDLPERSGEHGSAGDARVDPALGASTIGKGIAARLGLEGPLLYGGTFGDVYVDPRLTPAQRGQVVAEAMRLYAAHPQVEAVFARAQIAATPSPKGPPDSWTLIQRIRASFDAERSGEFYVVLKPRITPIASASSGYVATHGSIWDYDRRVPILFWRKGMTGFEQPLAIETADIAPTLAGLLRLKVPVEIDGRCLDLDAGPGDSCK
jgi:predicted AlkP superfamily pyrophosphatase or phosphodiesterase